MRVKTGAASLVLGVAAVIGLAAVACGTFGTTTEAPVGGDGGGDGPTSGTDAEVVDPALDASSGVDGAPTAAECTPAKAPSCSPSTCSSRTLYVPDAPSHPFAIATDDASVYWLEQRDANESVSYNGNAKARVLRTARNGSIDATKAAVLAVNQPAAMALALAAPYLYWATWDGANASLWRLTATCSPPACTPDFLVTVNTRIVKLVARGADLVGLGEGGDILHLATANPGSLLEIVTTGEFPGMAATDKHVYASSANANRIARASISGADVTPAWAPLSFDAGSNVGLGTLATDCNDLFGMHGLLTEVMRVRLSTGVVSRLTALDKHVYDMAADARYLYIAALDGAGGVYAIDTATGSVSPKLSVSGALALAVDDAGVYWGDHPTTNGGKLVMLVK
jgi:hypothetical protein